jgi:hypothetical protein
MKMIELRSADLAIGLHRAWTDAPEISQDMVVVIQAGAANAIFDSTICGCQRDCYAAVSADLNR